jgi:mRNA-degrading endonuclease toxin of MazEF toxin-antitoxin module
MLRAEQGSILCVNGISWPVIVVSNDHFNAIGEAIVCPILNNIAPNAVHLPICISSASGEIKGLIACEHVRHVDLNVRRFAKLGSLVLTDYLDISDTLMALFDFR